MNIYRRPTPPPMVKDDGKFKVALRFIVKLVQRGRRPRFFTSTAENQSDACWQEADFQQRSSVCNSPWNTLVDDEVQLLSCNKTTLTLLLHVFSTYLEVNRSRQVTCSWAPVFLFSYLSFFFSILQLLFLLSWAHIRKDLMEEVVHLFFRLLIIFF